MKLRGYKVEPHYHIYKIDKLLKTQKNLSLKEYRALKSRKYTTRYRLKLMEREMVSVINNMLDGLQTRVSPPPRVLSTLNNLSNCCI